jgi:myo-inositol-1(or 4)-monophosphatase
MARRSPQITAMINATMKCARSLQRDFGEVEHLQVSKKGPADFVSAADIKAEKVLYAELSQARPDYGFLLERSGAIKGNDPESRWVIDPLDGTINFLHSIPHFAISVGLERQGRMVAGVIYDPLRNELFWAEDGVGAYLNDHRMRVSARTELGDAVIGTGMPFKGREAHPEYSDQLDRIMGHVAGIRRMGSAALDLAYVAAGRYDGFWEYGLSLWDIAAGMLLVTEAGGLISEIGGGRDFMASGDVIATNSYLHDPISRLIENRGG